MQHGGVSLLGVERLPPLVAEVLEEVFDEGFHTLRSVVPILLLPALLEQGLQFGDALKISRSPGRPLQLNEFLQRHSPKTDTASFDLFRMRQQLAVIAASGHFT
jgi:hypothetical protein